MSRRCVLAIDGRGSQVITYGGKRDCVTKRMAREMSRTQRERSSSAWCSSWPFTPK
eukprot:CAMPEP_0183480018 /NCGR_PEP_ID=MMETSP0370-20130417/172605_1 /TAXON_ID=268820 /ORGANISM="Peridinium aciculiferum, Strain PAER-2" /LENGTH=55 /DNA_ID=CAMNT_0025673075 /DNA_START=54 /DNA_END=221 /DNA_ORIENTATION=-